MVDVTILLYGKGNSINSEGPESSQRIRLPMLLIARGAVAKSMEGRGQCINQHLPVGLGTCTVVLLQV